MSRALDPQLHTHVVAANLARGEDGRYTALHRRVAVPGGEDRGVSLPGAPARARHATGWAWSGGRCTRVRRSSRRSGAAVVEHVLAAPSRDACASAERGRDRPGVKERGGAGGGDRDPGSQAVRHRDAHLARGDHGPRRRARPRPRAGRGARGRRAASSCVVAASPCAPVWTSSALGERGSTGAGVGLTERSNTFDERAVLREFAAAAARRARGWTTVRAQAGRFAEREDVLATARRRAHDRGARGARARADRGRGRAGPARASRNVDHGAGRACDRQRLTVR